MSGKLDKPNPAAFIAAMISQAFEQAAQECDAEAERVRASMTGGTSRENQLRVVQAMGAHNCAERIRAMAGERDPPFCARRDGCPDIMACASFGVPGYCGERNG